MKQDSRYCCQHIMQQTFQKNVEMINFFFSSLKTAEERYHALIEMGSKLAPLPESFKTPENLVQGCQSTLYLHTTRKENQLFFQASCDALISAGLAALLISTYNGESPETILTHPPDFIKDLGIYASLSPSRSNGLVNIHLKMKQDALKYLLKK